MSFARSSSGMPGKDSKNFFASGSTMLTMAKQKLKANKAVKSITVKADVSSATKWTCADGKDDMVHMIMDNR